MNHYRANGKQVLRYGEHVADATDTTWAQIIVDALNGERVPSMDKPLTRADLERIAKGDMAPLAPIGSNLFDDRDYMLAAVYALDGDDSDLHYVLTRAWAHDEFCDWQRAARTPREEQFRSDTSFWLWLNSIGRAAMNRAIEHYNRIAPTIGEVE